MSYYAIQVVAGRENYVKNTINSLLEKKELIYVTDVFVPSQTVYDFTDSDQSKIEFNIAYPSYVFIAVDDSPGSNYSEMNPDLYNFLKIIPNIKNILQQSIAKEEISDLLGVWNNKDQQEVIAFSAHEYDSDTECEKNSTTMKAKEFIANKHTITKLRKTLSGSSWRRVIHIKENIDSLNIIVSVPFLKIALRHTAIKVKDFIRTPYRVLNYINNYIEEYAYGD